MTINFFIHTSSKYLILLNDLFPAIFLRIELQVKQGCYNFDFAEHTSS